MTRIRGFFLAEFIQIGVQVVCFPPQTQLCSGYSWISDSCFNADGCQYALPPKTSSLDGLRHFASVLWTLLRSFRKRSVGTCSAICD